MVVSMASLDELAFQGTARHAVSMHAKGPPLPYGMHAHKAVVAAETLQIARPLRRTPARSGRLATSRWLAYPCC